MDLLIVSGRRPKLLEKTLHSLGRNIRVDFSNVIVNLDPWGGNDNDHEETKSIIKNYYKDAIINQPKTPNFCSAVKFLWSSVKSEYALHTEDDWIWNQEFDEKFFIKGLKSAGMYRFVTLQNGGYNKYGTSPCVITKKFAHEAAAVLDTNMDPEKQKNHNSKLNSVVKKHKVLSMNSRGISAIDIGREWRDERKIVKIVSNGKSNWKKNDTN